MYTMAATDTKPRGGKPDKHVRDALIAAARQNDFASLKRMAEKVLEKAMEGDMQAVTFIADRIDGKAVQPIVGDDEHPKLFESITVNLVRADRNT
jgi:hypothetical protein